MIIDVIQLTKDLIACPSVTPLDEGAQAILDKHLTDMNFTVHHLPFENIKNIFARLDGENVDDGKHLCYAGHTDVVPAGDQSAWTYGPFTPTIVDGVLYGRGSSDMKGSVAAFTAAVSKYLDKHGAPNGSISMLITGDEEADAEFGTVKVLEWMAENGHTPDVGLVGEPTNLNEMGEEIKIGRRGSLTGTITVTGKQGHVAYPHLADNPLPRLAKMVDTLATYTFDEGTSHFSPTSLQFTTIDVGNPADNVIPAGGTAMFNVRFNDTWSCKTLGDKLRKILDNLNEPYELCLHASAESFMTQPGEWTDTVRDAVADVTGKTPAYTTTGGTSDARFVTNYCPVIECGAINKSIHQVDENARVADLEMLVDVYVRVLERYFGQA